MFIYPDYLKDGAQCVSSFAALPDNELCYEYIIIQSLYAAFDEVTDTIGFSDSWLLGYLDFYESYLEQEICNRLCERSVSLSVPRYPMV
ncbi:MAG: hypothetical protein HFI33_15295 [Lachnospiraceae bacterium]|nr:hypothetical protein [Lachnospiraceae bacterium]